MCVCVLADLFRFNRIIYTVIYKTLPLRNKVTLVVSGHAQWRCCVNSEYRPQADTQPDCKGRVTRPPNLQPLTPAIQRKPIRPSHHQSLSAPAVTDTQHHTLHCLTVFEGTAAWSLWLHTICWHCFLHVVCMHTARRVYVVPSNSMKRQLSSVWRRLFCHLIAIFWVLKLCHCLSHL